MLKTSGAGMGHAPFRPKHRVAARGSLEFYGLVRGAVSSGKFKTFNQ